MPVSRAMLAEMGSSSCARSISRSASSSRRSGIRQVIAYQWWAVA
jgi:hypothetical protein